MGLHGLWRSVLVRPLKEPKVLDIETDGREPWEGNILCIGWGGLVYSGPALAQGSRLRLELADPEQPIITHTKYDARYLRLKGWEVTGPFYDTQVMAWMLNENQPLDLDSLAMKYLQVKMDKRLRRSNNIVWFRGDDGKEVELSKVVGPTSRYWDELIAYCQRDIDTELELFQELKHLLEVGMWWDHYVTEEVPYTAALLEMEVAGIPIDLHQNTVAHRAVEWKTAELGASLLTKLGYDINLDSGDQLAEVLFSRLWHQESRLPKRESYPPGFTVVKEGRLWAHGYWTRKGMKLKKTPKTPSGKRCATTTPELLTLHADNPWVQELVQYRKHKKILTTYTSVFPQRSHRGRLYGRFNQTGTKTGRLSSSGPNLQNIPAHGELGHTIRSLFQGALVVGDYSQLEPRLMAHFSGDPVLLDTYRNDKDIYLVTAAGVFGKQVTKADPERQIAKTLMLALSYGAGANKLAQVLCLNGFPTTQDVAQAYLDEMEALFAGLFKWKKAVIESCKRKGYVKTIGGRYRRLKHQFAQGASWKTQGYGERQAVNAVVQGSAGDVVRRAMLDIRNEPRVTMLAQVHDEVVMEHHLKRKRHDLLDRLQKMCENPGYELSVPLKFEPMYCNTWADKGADVEWIEESDEE